MGSAARALTIQETVRKYASGSRPLGRVRFHRPYFLPETRKPRPSSQKAGFKHGKGYHNGITLIVRQTAILSRRSPESRFDPVYR
jgi:hypothetical protein